MVLEVLDEQRATAYWFTYDDQGQQRWLIGVGAWEQSESGMVVSFPELKRVTGGVFGDAFDAGDIERETVGSATFSATDCDSAEWSFEAFGSDASYEMVRLSHPMTQRCGKPQGLPGDAFESYAGQSGAWYNPERNGEGFTLQWITRNQALLAWFTFDAAGNQQWMTGIGEREGDKLVFPGIATRSGGTFTGEIPDGSVTTQLWGDLELELSCAGGAMRYLPADGSIPAATIDIQPLSRIRGISCPYQRPTFRELFDLTITDIPMHAGDGVAQNFNATGISEDGTVVLGQYTPSEGVNVYSYTPGDLFLTYKATSGTGSVQNLLPLIDKTTNEFVHNINPTESGTTDGKRPARWVDGNGWQELPPPDGFDWYTVYAISRDGSALAGRARRADYDADPPIAYSYAWNWTESTGFQSFSLMQGFTFALAYGVSNDAKTMVGKQRRTIPDSGGQTVDVATRWIDGEAEVLATDSGDTLHTAYECAEDCRTIIGAWMTDQNHPKSRESWIWTEDSGVIFLGEVADSASPEYTAFTASADGSLVAGTYLMERPSGVGLRSTFLWTPATGSISLLKELEEAGLNDQYWYSIQPNDITSDGGQLLIAGQRAISFTGKAAVLNIQGNN